MAYRTGGAGRPTKLTSETTDKVCEALRLGNTRGVAAACGGISRDSFNRYMENAEFAAAVEKAEAEAEETMVAQIRRATTDGTWQAAAWWLERRRYREWGRRERLEHTGKDDGPVEVETRVKLAWDDPKTDGNDPHYPTP